MLPKLQYHSIYIIYLKSKVNANDKMRNSTEKKAFTHILKRFVHYVLNNIL